MSWTPQTDLDSSLLSSLKAELRVTDTTDDARLTALLADAESVLHSEYGLTTVPAAVATRVMFADGLYLPLWEPVTITAVADADGNAIGYTPTTDGIYFDGERAGDVSITATWGAATRPAYEARAIVLTAATYYRRSTYGTDDAPYRGGGDPIPTEARRIMRAARGVRF